MKWPGIIPVVRKILHGSRIARAAHLDIASTNRENVEHWKEADCWDADKCNDPASRQLARNRSRLETDNNPSLKGNIKTLVNYELGRGSTLHVDHDNQDFARDVEENYGLWREATNHVGKFWTMIYARIQDGESFCRIGRNPNLRHPEDIDRPFPVQVDWQPFEADRCYTYWLPPYTPGRVDGVWFDDWGNPTYYDILRYHPGGVFPLGVIQYDTVPAQYLTHLYFPERPGQHRGVPEFASSIGMLGIRRRYCLATVEAAETAAKISVYLKTNSPPGMEPDEAGPPMAMRIPRNSAWPLPQGWDIAQVKPEHPAQTYESYSEVTLNEAMRPKSVPRNVALCDSSKYNMASGRLDITTLWESIGIDQRNNTWRVENPLFRAWYTEARQVYKTGGKRWSEIDGGTIPKRVFMWQRERYSDPEVQQGADEKAIATGLKGIQDVYADKGLDWSRQQIINAKNLGMEVDEYLDWVKSNLGVAKGGVGPGQDQQGADDQQGDLDQTGADDQDSDEPQEPIDGDSPEGIEARARKLLVETYPGLAKRLNGHNGNGRKAKAAASLVSGVPDIRQDTDYRCGAAASMAVGKFFGVGPDTLDEWSEALGTTAAKSTSPEAIVSYLSALGLEVNARQNMSVDDLAWETRDGRPVIVCCQNYIAQNTDPRDEQAEWDYGHWMICLAVQTIGDTRFLIFQDSSEENMERLPGGDVPKEDEDPEYVVEEPGRRFVSEKRWLPAWHDEAVDGVMYDHYGIAVGLAEKSTPSAALLQTAAATIGGSRFAAAKGNFDESKHPRGNPKNAGEFGSGGGGGKSNSTPGDKSADKSSAGKGNKGTSDKGNVGHGARPHTFEHSTKATSAKDAAKEPPPLKLTKVKQRAFSGQTIATKNTLSKSDTGKIGENIIISYCKTFKGRKDARHLNLDRNNFPIDLVQDHESMEVKAGLVSNRGDTQRWRLTIGEPGKAEKEWLAKASDAAKAKWNANKQQKIKERKAKCLANLTKELGKPVKAKTLTCIINPDTKTADIFEFDGWHDRIGWKSPEAQKAYVCTVKYE